MKRISVVLLAFLPIVAHATVTSQSTSVSFTCTGSVGPYPFTFPISSASALTVTQSGTVLPSTSYAIAPVNNNYSNGGNVTLNSPCPSGNLVLLRVTPLTQTTAYYDNMPAPMVSIGNSLDKLTEIDQELVIGVNGTEQFPSPNFNSTTPPPQTGYVNGTWQCSEVNCSIEFPITPFSCPPSGCTLTGPLYGTSASFSGNESIGGNSTITGSVTAATSTIGIANGIYNASQFGVKCDGSTDDSTALNSIGTFASSQTTAGNTITVSFPSNATCVHTLPITTWLVPSLHVEGNGSVLQHNAASNGSIYAVKLSSGGAYSVCPTGISFSGSGGTGATATLTCAGSSPNIAVNGVTMTQNGSSYPVSATTVNFTGGTGTAATATAIINPQIFLHNIASETDNTEIRGLVLSGNINSTWGIYEDSLIARGKLQIINIRDHPNCGYFADPQGMNEFDITCSKNKANTMGPTETVIPTFGIQLGDILTNSSFAGNRYENVTIEGVNGTGILASYGCCQNLLTGTSEGNVTGMITQQFWGNSNTQIDLEQNSSVDLIEGGRWNTYHTLTGELAIQISSTATFTEIDHTSFNSLTIASGANNLNIHDFIYGTASGTITITGTPVASTITGIQSGTGTPYNFSTKTPIVTGGPSYWNTVNTGQSSARNYCWSLDASGYGLYELWASSTATGTACYNGSPLMQINPTVSKFMGNLSIYPTYSVFTQPTVIGSSGSLIHNVYYATGSPTYTSITAPGCQEQPVTVTGAVSGDVCWASTPSLGLTYYYGGCRISGANTAQLKVCATTTGAPGAVSWVVWDMD